MNYGRDQRGNLVHAAQAVRGLTYVCPNCGLPLELRRGHDLEYFAHWRGLEGTRECELFAPRDGGSIRPDDLHAPNTRAEDGPSELGLVLDLLDGAWTLGLRIPEIPDEEIGRGSLAELRPARVDVLTGGRILARVSALDLRSGVGAARVPVPPSLKEYRSQAAGSWPQTIDTERWALTSRAIDAKGTLFRLRQGEWTRLSADSGVLYGERLLVLGDTRCAPPAPTVRDVHPPLSSGGIQWTIWEVEIPSDPSVGDASVWLARIGHSLVRRPWSVTLVTPARSYDEHGVPVFWAGDLPLLALDAPMPGVEAIATLTVGSNSYSEIVRSADDPTHVLLESRSASLTTFRVTSDRSARFDSEFVERPSHAAVLDLLASTPRLRVWIGDRCLEAWRGDGPTVRLGAHELSEVRVDLGGDTERARVTVWKRGKQRSYHGLSAREVSTTVVAAFATASLVEIDADNLGRIELAPAACTSHDRDRGAAHDRLAWRNHVVSMLAGSGEHAVATVLERPRAASGLVPRCVGAAPLVQARLALRKRRATGDSLP